MEDARLKDAGLEDEGLEDAGLEDGGLEEEGLEDGGIEDGGLEDEGLEDGWSQKIFDVLAFNGDKERDNAQIFIKGSEDVSSSAPPFIE